MNKKLTISSLRDRGYKITNTRNAIVDVFSEADTPLSIKNILKKLRGKNIDVNITTIYREVEFLVKENYLTEVFINQKEKLFEPMELIHHHHLICDVCGSIENVTNCVLKGITEDVYKKKGFKIARHNLEFFGTCSSCRNS